MLQREQIKMARVLGEITPLLHIIGPFLARTIIVPLVLVVSKSLA